MGTTEGAGGAPVYGSIYIHDGATAQSVNNGAAQQVTGFNTAQGADGAANGVTPAKVSNQITLPNAGVYWVFFQCGFQGGSNVTWQIHVHDGGGELANLGTKRKTPTNDVGSCSLGGYYSAAAAAVLTLYVEHDGGVAANFTPIEVEFAVHRIDGSG